MTLQQSRRLQSLLLGTLAWAIAILIFFPIFWMVLTSFKSEIDAFAWNSVVISFSATALAMLIAATPSVMSLPDLARHLPCASTAIVLSLKESSDGCRSMLCIAMCSTSTEKR